MDIFQLQNTINSVVSEAKNIANQKFSKHKIGMTKKRNEMAMKIAIAVSAGLSVENPKLKNLVGDFQYFEGELIGIEGKIYSETERIAQDKLQKIDSSFVFLFDGYSSSGKKIVSKYNTKEEIQKMWEEQDAKSYPFYNDDLELEVANIKNAV